MARLAQHDLAATSSGLSRGTEHRNSTANSALAKSSSSRPSAATDAAISAACSRSRVGEFAQDAVHFAQLFFVQPDQFVVQLDGLERLDEHRVRRCRSLRESRHRRAARGP